MNVFTLHSIGFAVEPAPVDGASVRQMLSRTIAGRRLSKRVRTDRGPLFRFHRGLADMRILEIAEIESAPYTPDSHPMVERLIGTIRREYLDRVFFWNATDQRRKLDEFKDYCNAARVHRGLAGDTPAQRAGLRSPSPVALLQCGRLQHCRGLLQVSIAA
jgi:transposase InsO family protein